MPWEDTSPPPLSVFTSEIKNSHIGEISHIGGRQEQISLRGFVGPSWVANKSPPAISVILISWSRNGPWAYPGSLIPFAIHCTVLLNWLILIPASLRFNPRFSTKYEVQHVRSRPRFLVVEIGLPKTNDTSTVDGRTQSILYSLMFFSILASVRCLLHKFYLFKSSNFNMRRHEQRSCVPTPALAFPLNSPTNMNFDAKCEHQPMSPSSYCDKLDGTDCVQQGEKV